MFELLNEPIVKRNALALMMLLALAPLSLRAQKKNSQPPAQQAAAKQEIPDFTKIQFPYAPAVARVRYMDYFATSLPDFGDNNKEQKKQRWMDRLAGVDPNAGSKKAPKIRYALYTPYGVAVDSKGLLYVADTKVGAVFMFNTENDDVQLIRNGVEGHFKSILGLAIDDADHLFVTDNELHMVQEFDPNHKLVSSFGADVLKGPCGIAIDEENRFLYVVDTDLDQVFVFDADSHEVLRKIGTTGKNHTLTEPGDFSKPTNAAVDQDGNLYVTDTLNDRVEVFDADGNFIRTWGKNGDGAGDFARPKGIAIDADGHVWVADAMLNRMQIFTPEGQLLLAFGNFGDMPGQFQALTGLTIDKNNRVFAAEQFLGRVQMFRYYTDAEARAELEKRKAARDAKKQTANAQPAGASSAAPPATAAASSAASTPASPAQPKQ
jgi:DNA-binding beta-propeller fold protein YncE